MRAKFLIIRLTLITLLLNCSEFALAQTTPTPSIDNLSEVRVDDLTDDQILQFIDKVEESGLSQQQLEILAKQRGMSSTEIAKLRTRILNVKTNGTSTSGVETSSDINRLRDDPIDQIEEDQFAFFEQLILPDSLKEDELQIFGLSIFRNANVNFQPSVNIPTPRDYVLGPGDEVIIDIYGALKTNFKPVLTSTRYCTLYDNRSAYH